MTVLSLICHGVSNTVPFNLLSRNSQSHSGALNSTEREAHVLELFMTEFSFTGAEVTTLLVSGILIVVVSAGTVEKDSLTVGITTPAKLVL
jgi:hypothetical protein